MYLFTPGVRESSHRRLEHRLVRNCIVQKEDQQPRSTRHLFVLNSRSAPPLLLITVFVLQAGRSSASAAVKKQSSDWSSSGWDADDSWSNEKEGQGQSSAGEEGWGNDWAEEEETDAASAGAAVRLPEGVRLASEYNWDTGGGSAKAANQNDLFASLSQRNTGAATVREKHEETVLDILNSFTCESEFALKSFKTLCSKICREVI